MKNELIGRKALIKDSGSVKQWTIAAVHDHGLIIMDENGRVPTPCMFHPSKLEILPVAETNAPKGYLNTDSMRVACDEATEWFAFVMLQADILFTNMPDEEARNEVKRILMARGLSEDGPAVTAAMAYIDTANDWYRKDAEGELG